MSYTNLRRWKWGLMAALFGLSVQFASGSAAPVVSGSYQVVKNKVSGSYSQVEMRIWLLNHGRSDFYIQRISLSDFPDAKKGSSGACSVALPAHASAEIIRQFTVRRSDYQMWEKGLRPRLVLQIATPGHSKSRAVVRLDRVSSQEAK